MQMLVKGNDIMDIAARISYGIYDEDFNKWRLADENDNLIYYYIDDNFTLVENVEIPDDYVPGKYLYVDGSLILNDDYVEYKTTEERLAELEEQNAMLTECLLEMSEIIYSGLLTDDEMPE